MQAMTRQETDSYDMFVFVSELLRKLNGDRVLCRRLHLVPAEIFVANKALANWTPRDHSLLTEKFAANEAPQMCLGKGEINLVLDEKRPGSCRKSGWHRGIELLATSQS